MSWPGGVEASINPFGPSVSYTTPTPQPTSFSGNSSNLFSMGINPPGGQMSSTGNPTTNFNMGGMGMGMNAQLNPFGGQNIKTSNNPFLN